LSENKITVIWVLDDNQDRDIIKIVACGGADS
jgi:hypothetical protein